MHLCAVCVFTDAKQISNVLAAVNQALHILAAKFSSSIRRNISSCLLKRFRYFSTQRLHTKIMISSLLVSGGNLSSMANERKRIQVLYITQYNNGKPLQVYLVNIVFFILNATCTYKHLNKRQSIYQMSQEVRLLY